MAQKIAFGIYFAIIAIGFTFWNFPADAQAFCAANQISPNFDVMYFLEDIGHHPNNAILQIAFNIIFFVPLGIFGRTLFHFGFFRTALAGFAFSLIIELIQLSNLLGLMPCAFRTFDVDDLIFNTLGSILGFLSAFIASRFLRVSRRNTQ